MTTLTDSMFENILSNLSMLAIVYGVIGDNLAVSKHPLAISMHFNLKGQLLPMDQLKVLPCINGKLIILVHGLCMAGATWAERLLQIDQQEKAAKQYSLMGYTPICLRYNSGCHISTNGQEFATLLESLVKSWAVPVQELVIVGFSMGGLVSRSACHYGALAGHLWLQHLTKIVFIATPHHGSPLERRGNWLDRMLSLYRITAPLSRLGKIRSAGITDLRYGNLLDTDWEGLDRFEAHEDRRQIVALPVGVQCYVIAATHGKRAGDLGDRFLGDGLVPLSSALGHHEDPARCLQFAPLNQWIGYGMSHLKLLRHSDIHAQLKTWLTIPTDPKVPLAC